MCVATPPTRQTFTVDDNYTAPFRERDDMDDPTYVLGDELEEAKYLAEELAEAGM